MFIFSGNSNRELAEKVCQILSVPLSSLEMTVFPDGEKRVRVLDRVVDQDCVVIQSTAAPVDQNYMELMFIIDALRRSGSRSVTAVIPYMGYQRQDHIFRDGEAVSLDVVIKAIESLGVSKIITFDLHSIKIRQEFHTDISHLSALAKFGEKIKKESLNENTVLVSPDDGGIGRIKILSKMLNDMPCIAISKDRNLDTGKITVDNISGKVLNRAIIIDDMISSGKTIVAAADLLLQNGAKEVIAMATHAVFSNGVSELLQNSDVSRVIVTDSIFVPSDKKFDKLEVLSIAEEIAKELNL